MNTKKIKKQGRPVGSINRNVRRRISPKRVLKAIPGSCGIFKTIAANLGCNPCSLGFVLKTRKGPEWDNVRKTIEIEAESMGDMAEETVRDTIRQRLDLSVASTTARWYLDRKHPDRGYGKKSQVTLEGGDKPLQIQNHTILPIQDLNLPIEIKAKILEAMDEYEEKKKAESR